jgi:hypothetical protein
LGSLISTLDLGVVLAKDVADEDEADEDEMIEGDMCMN